MEMENQVLVKWNEVKLLVDMLELDVVKNSSGVAAAGVRARKGLRELKAKVGDLVKMTVELDKVNKGNKSSRGFGGSSLSK